MDNNKRFEDREMHDAVCSDCGAETKVPFKPVEGRPVYCKECFQKHRPQRTGGARFGGGGGGRGRDRNSRSNDSWDE